MRKIKHVYRKRTFLNEDLDMSAFVIASLQKFHIDKEDQSVSSYPTLDISDCNNKISLDFSFYQESDMKKSFKKLQKLKTIVNEFSDAFEKEMQEYEKIPRVPKKRKKKKATARRFVTEIVDDNTSD